jgi:hypothetical protein
MSDAERELFLLRVALPPARLGVYVKRLNARRVAPHAALLVSILVTVAGCAASARSERMVAQVAAVAPATLRGRLAVTDVTSSNNSEVGSGTLRQAVETSLRNAGYLNADPAAATMLLAVAMISLERGDIGVATTSRIRYLLTSRATGASVFNEVVVKECAKYAFAAWERLQISAECSVRDNIEAFLQKMLLLQVDQ